MPTTKDYYRKRISGIWSATRTTLKEKNTNLLALRDVIVPALPEGISVESEDEKRISFTNSNGHGFILQRDYRYRVSCWFPKTMDAGIYYNIERIEPKSLAGFATALFAGLSGWHAEYNELKIKEIKRSKIKSIAERNIGILVNEIMKDLNYQYYLENRETKVLLNIKIKAKRKLEIPISHKSFISQIPLIPSTICKFEELCNQVEIKVEIKSYGNHLNWTKGGTHAG
jgi:hypothetical protein